MHSAISLIGGLGGAQCTAKLKKEKKADLLKKEKEGKAAVTSAIRIFFSFFITPKPRVE